MHPKHSPPFASIEFVAKRRCYGSIEAYSALLEAIAVICDILKLF
jgi:hypothetical protein